MEEDRLYMQRCLDLAAIAAGEGESPVGSIIVKNGRILGEGYEKARQLKERSFSANIAANWAGPIRN